MARRVKEEEYALKRNQILDVAQRLIYSKGYEKMTIQDVLAGAQMSKGAFYHYFDSKQALLSAMIERMMVEVEKLMTSIADDPELPALEKMRRYFTRTAVWKTERIDLMYPLMRVWYSDENTVTRHWLTREATRRLGPLFAQIVRQGVREGVMNSEFPEEVVQLIYSSVETLGETLTHTLLERGPLPARMAQLERAFAFISDTLERLLGAPAGSLPLMDRDLILEWLQAPGPAAA